MEIVRLGWKRLVEWEAESSRTLGKPSGLHDASAVLTRGSSSPGSTVRLVSMVWLSPDARVTASSIPRRESVTVHSRSGESSELVLVRVIV